MKQKKRGNINNVRPHLLTLQCRTYEKIPVEPAAGVAEIGQERHQRNQGQRLISTGLRVNQSIQRMSWRHRNADIARVVAKS
jgi:hypothetical protein